MPPPIRMTSAFSIRFAMTWILSLIFAPPMMAANGRSGFSITPSRKSISFFRSSPDTIGISLPTPAMDAWLLCDTPNASLTARSQPSTSAFAKPGSFFSSSLWKRRFSRSRTSPGARAAFFSFASSPMQSEANFTSMCSSSERRLATGARDRSGFTSPFGRPIWLAMTSAAPWSKR